MNKLINKIKKNKTEFIILMLILILASFLRLYKLNDYLHFADDEGRDAFVIKNMIENTEIPLLGPEASMGHFHLGPIYYYLISPFFLLLNLNPVAGAFIVSMLGVASVFLMWLVPRKIFTSKVAGLISSFLFSVLFIVVLHSRWSWNLNPMPFFVLMYIYSFWNTLNNKNVNIWFCVWILTIAIMPHLHASAFLFMPISLILLLVHKIKHLNWKNYLSGAIIFIILNIPLIIYEILNRLENTIKIKNMVFNGSDKSSFIETLWHNLLNFGELMNALIFANFHGLDFNLLFGNSKNIEVPIISIIPGFILFIFLIIFTIFYSIKFKNDKGFRFVAFISLMIFPGFVIFRQIYYIHYYIILFPIIVIMLGFALSYFYKKCICSKIISMIFIALIAYLNMSYLLGYWDAISMGKWTDSYGIPYFQMEKSVEYIVNNAKNDKINIICEVEGYCIAFQYVFDLKNVQTDKGAVESYRIFNNNGLNSRFGPIEVEKIKK